MSLGEHLRELRSRLVKSGIAVVLGMVVGWIIYPQTFRFLSAPFEGAVQQAQDQGRDVTLALTGVTDPFVLQLQVAAITGILLAAPIWLYQLWRFVTPGLHKHEKKWGIAFVVVATPLFFSGAVLAYVVLPLGLEILLGFTPENVENIVSVDRYLSFFLRVIIVFGIGFLIPLLIVTLNFAGVLSGKRLASWWRWIVFLTFVFAAVATPTGDPINLILLAGPILILVMGAVGIALLNDRRRAKRKGVEPDYQSWDDDETSPLEDDLDEDPVAEPLHEASDATGDGLDKTT